jgi:CDP-diacylglycerol--glycerol-3-phosphate 3-phosphatidyltransferase
MDSAEIYLPGLVPLRRRWLIVALLWVSVVALTYTFVRSSWQWHIRWLTFTSLTSIYALLILRRHLAANHAPHDSALLPTLGYGNGLTIFRALCLCLIAGFSFGDWPPYPLNWVIALTYTIAAIADFFDGFVARITDHVTELGAILDMEYDGLAMVIVTLLAVSFGQLPWWYLLLGFARYFFVFGLWVREQLNLPTYALQPSVHRRIFAGFQMGFMAATIWPIVPVGMATIGGVVFGALTMAGFVRDWFVVIGRINVNSPRYKAIQHTLFILLKQWLPLACRIVIAISMISILNTNSLWRPLFESQNIPLALPLITLFAGLGVIGGVAVSLGIAPRLAALLLVFPVGFDMWIHGTTWFNGFAAAAISVVMVLGPGRFALWPIEERFIGRKAGAKDES